MKIASILFGVLAVAFILVQLFALNSQRNIEMYPYVVTKTYDQFEIRQYNSTLFTTVKLSNSSYKEASSEGFSILAGYIFGANERREKIAMTSPVAMTLEDSMTMSFMVPRKFDLKTLPQPNQSQILFKEEPAKTVAAISFNGWANDAKIEKYKQQLISALISAGLTHSNRFQFLGYNAPYEVFNRKNEVIVELQNDNSNQN
ncbi:MAG: heme-binding protein [Flavobacteriaceae bacterium]|nr:heme-binding protein [Flavobacteriaceae bacterium]MDG1041776.1 heme-binding protein [Flavobacteriaceae bacterium]